MSHKVIHDFQSLVLDNDVRGVLIDLDNTFYRYEPCHQAGIAAAQKTIETFVGPVENFSTLYKEAQKTVKERIPNLGASHSRILYFQSLLETLERGSIISASLAAEEAYWDAFFKKMEPTPGLESFLESCKKKGLPVVIISDLTSRIQFKKILVLGLEKLISAIVTSEEAGAEKPAPHVFTLGLKKARLEARDVIVIGDSLSRDIEGAKRLNIRAIQICNDEFAQETSLR